MTSINFQNYPASGPIKMAPKKSSLSPTISHNKSVNANDSLLGVSRTEYDSTSIASVSESSHWSTGNGDDENIALVPGVEATLENKEWSTYINVDKDTYNSSDEEVVTENRRLDKMNKKKRIENLMNDKYDDDDDDDDTVSAGVAAASTVKRNTLTRDEIDNKKFATGVDVDSDNTEENHNDSDADGDNSSIKKHSDKGTDDDDDDENGDSDDEEDEEDDDDDDDDGDGDNNIDFDDIYTIKPKLLKYYEKQFKTMQSDINGMISGSVAKSFFEKSKLPLNELSRIWELSDVNRDGALSFSEFSTAMHLVVLRVRNFDLPEQLPQKLQPYAPLIDFESDEHGLSRGNNTEKSGVESTSHYQANEKDSASSILSNTTIISPITSADSPVAFSNNPLTTDQNIVHPVALRVRSLAGSTPSRPPVVPPPRNHHHSRSSSLGSITNRVQPPAVPPREQQVADNDTADAQQQPPPIPPPPPSHPPLASSTAQYPPPLPPPPPPPLPPPVQQQQQQLPLPPPPSTTTTLIYQQNQIENMVEQMHNVNIEQLKKLSEFQTKTNAAQKQQYIDELTSQIKLQKENQTKLKKFLTDLEKEYRNLTDTRIALEIKHESLLNPVITSTINGVAPVPPLTPSKTISPPAATSSSSYI